MSNKLTEKQKAFLDFIKAYIEKNTISPSLQELQRAFSYKSISTVQSMIWTLTLKGYLEFTPNKARSLKVIDLPKA